MTDAAKWKSVMLRVDAYDLLKQIAARDRRSIASILTELVEKEWEWHFERETHQETKRIVKDPVRQTPAQAYRNHLKSSFTRVALRIALWGWENDSGGRRWPYWMLRKCLQKWKVRE